MFHSVPWTGLARSGVLFGEADFIVVNQAGDILESVLFRLRHNRCS
jgi:hypothetical protein